MKVIMYMRGHALRSQLTTLKKKTRKYFAPRNYKITFKYIHTHTYIYTYIYTYIHI